MPGLTGTEAVLSTDMQDKIKTKLEDATTEEIIEPTFLKAICDGISEAIVPHLVTNIIVKSKDIVTKSQVPGHDPGGAVPNVPGVIETDTVII